MQKKKKAEESISNITPPPISTPPSLSNANVKYIYCKTTCEQFSPLNIIHAEEK